MSLRNNFGIFTLAAVCAIPLTAQTTCTTAPASVTNLSIERVLTLSNVLTTITPNVSPAILAAITSGAQEIRSRIIYNPTQNTVTDTTFLVAPGSPNPTPLFTDLTQSTVLGYTLNVDRVYISCKPTPSVMFVGTISAPNGPFGNYTGAPGAISVGYTTDATPKINNVVEVVAGTVVAYSASANGTITFPATPVTPVTPTGNPVVVLNPAPPAAGSSTQVFFNPYQVSAAGSTDPANLALTYMWTSDKTASFGPSNTVANPLITFQAGAGDYTITVTVTNSAGLSSSQSFILTYINK